MLEFTLVDFAKIAIAVASIVSLYYFRRQIAKIISDLVAGGDTAKYQGRTVSDIMEDLDERLKEVIG